MKAGSMQHFALAVLWEFLSGKDTLPSEALKRLADCDDCMTPLGICQRSESLAEAKWRVNDDNRSYNR
jgi:hypothetical protein